MLFEIKHRINGAVLFKLECASLKLCVVAAIKSGAYLRDAYLQGANLRDAYLRDADLRDANLRGANLRGANLQGANLQGADLQGAYLRDAYLQGANLRGSNLRGANLRGANLQGANLQGADLQGADDSAYIVAQTQICPTEGAFVGWKKLKGDVIAKLIILHDAQRMNSLGSRKCRASKVFVQEIFGANESYDKHTGKLLYKEGEEVEPDSYDSEVRVECSHGIHFFMTRIEAERY